MSKKITKKSEDYSRWYQDVIRQASLAEPAEVGAAAVDRGQVEFQAGLPDQLGKLFVGLILTNLRYPFDGFAQFFACRLYGGHMSPFDLYEKQRVLSCNGREKYPASLIGPGLNYR